MSEALRILSVGAGTLLAIVVFAVIVFWFIEDITQKKHAVLRNYPVIGRLRYFFEKQGEYFRQYFFAGDREEMPFNRATAALNMLYPYPKATAEAQLVRVAAADAPAQAGVQLQRAE